jgi:hypothetical protein
MMPWKILIAIILALGAVGSFFSFFDYGKRIIDWFKLPWGKRGPLHKVNLKITPDHSNCTWQEGGRYGKHLMIVRLVLHVTNTGPGPIAQIISAHIKKPFTRSGMLGRTNVVSFPQGIAVQVPFQFEVEPVGKSGQPWTCTIVLTDQYGDEHEAEVDCQMFSLRVWATPAV